MRGSVQDTRSRLAIAAFAFIAIPAVGYGQAPAGAVRFTVAPHGNEARYLVREQLMGLDLPNDAVGKTTRIEGGLAFTANGSIIKEESRFVIDLATLQSDRDMRDNYLRRRTLQTEQYANAVFVPTEIKHLKLPLPAAGNLSFQLIGDLTIRGVTRPATWRVAAKVANGALSGEARTSFTFADFQLEKPRVRSVLSVEDEIRLEYTFFLVPAR